MEVQAEGGEEMNAKEALEIMQGVEELGGTLPEDGLLVEEALDMAIEALKKQVPEKSVMNYGFPEKLREVMIHRGDKEKAEYKTDCCPVCKRPLGTSQFVKTQTGKAYGDPYCKRCGQKILWDE